MTKDLYTYYKKAALYPVIFTAVCGIFLAVTHDGSSYKSEWFSNDGFVETVVLTIGLSIIIASVSTTLFLNSVPLIKKNGFYSFVTWVVPAGSICVFIIVQVLDNFMNQSGYDGNRLLDTYILLVALAHLGSMLVTYILFRRDFRMNTVNHM